MLTSSRFKTRVVREESALPQTVDEIVEQVRAALKGGRVQGIILSVDMPLRVYRAVEDPVPDNTLDTVLSAVDIFEYQADESHGPADRIFGMTHLLAKEKLYPVCVVTGPNVTGLLDRWFQVKESGLPSGITDLAGLPVLRLASLPESTLVVCGSPVPFPDIEDIQLAIKTTIEIQDRKEDSKSQASSWVPPRFSK